jgi:O-antigen ligase/tetratricopeptide (TPR) repeat protein
MPPPSPAAGPASAALRGAMEAVVLVMTAAAPWAFGAVHPVAVFGLYCGLAAVLGLWAVRLLIDRRVAGGPCGVLGCVAGMVLLGVAQLAPLPADALSTVAPGTAALRAALVPAAPAGLAGEDPVPPPAHTVTLVPGATRQRVAELVAVLALFAAVRYGVASPGSFRRLAAVCVANAAALAVFALAQRFGGEPGTVYGVFRTGVQPFGPFVCRNHFPFYTNVCVGLGAGLLLTRRAFAARRGWADRAADLGRDTPALWLLAALGLVVAANVVSLSRGGVVALAAAGGAGGVLAARRHGGGVAGLGLVAAAGVGLVAWFGPAAAAARLATLDDSPLAEGRLQVWERVLPLAADFPLWGAGYGTFQFVEPLTRRPGDDPTLLWDHAHNDYLETLVEGGATHLLLAAVAIGLVVRAGVRAAGDRRDGPLAVGALLGFGTAAVHAAGDFGMHIPAVVVLVTVVAAHLAAAGARARGAADRTVGWPTAAAAAGACLVVAAVLPLDGWKRERAHVYWRAATRAELRLPPGQRGPAIDYLAAAAAWNPDDATIPAALSDFRQGEHQAHRAAGRADADAALLVPALRDDLRTRAANPLLPRPHVRLAAHAARLAPAEPAALSLARACRLNPADPTTWFLAGSQHLADGNGDAACVAWRRSLECGPLHLAAVVPAAAKLVGPAGLADRVVPPVPGQLAAAMDLLPPAARAAFAAPAAAAVAGLDLRAAADLHARARVNREAGRTDDAVRDYGAAVGRAPDRADWRFELADLLAGAGRPAEALEHARVVVRDCPDLPGAADLHAELVRRAAGR